MIYKCPLRWRQNVRDGVSNHQPHDCLLRRLFRRRSKKTSSSASLAFMRGIHRWPVNSPYKGPVEKKMFPFDDVFMHIAYINNINICVWLQNQLYGRNGRQNYSEWLMISHVFQKGDGTNYLRPVRLHMKRVTKWWSSQLTVKPITFVYMIKPYRVTYNIWPTAMIAYDLSTYRYIILYFSRPYSIIFCTPLLIQFQCYQKQGGIKWFFVMTLDFSSGYY